MGENSSIIVFHTHLCSWCPLWVILDPPLTAVPKYQNKKNLDTYQTPPPLPTLVQFISFSCFYVQQFAPPQKKVGSPLWGCRALWKISDPQPYFQNHWLFSREKANRNPGSPTVTEMSFFLILVRVLNTQQ